MRADLEVKVAAAIIFEDKPEEVKGPSGVIVEGPVDQLDLADLLVDQPLQVGFDPRHGK